MNILVLSGSSQKKLVEAAEKRKHYIEIFNPVDFNIYLSDKTSGYDCLYHNENEKLIAKDWDCVIPRIGSHREYATQVLMQLQLNMKKWSLQSSTAINTCANKIRTAQICSANKILVPKQWYAMQPKKIAFLIDKLGKLPVILKEITGSKGANIILLESPLQTNLTLESYYKKGVKFILQEYLQNGGKDQRHIVVGDKVVSSMERQAPAHDIRANVSLAGTAKKITATKEVEEMCIKAVHSIPGLNFAGVDIINCNDKNYLIEINSNPGEHIIDVTGHNYWEDVLDFCEYHHKEKQKLNNAAEKTEMLNFLNEMFASYNFEVSEKK